VAVDSVDLVDGGGRTLWPRPGRVFAAARSHSFAQLATAIDDAFARWDRAHLHMFDLGGGEGLLIDRYWDDPPDNSRVDDTVKLSTLTGGPSQPPNASTPALLAPLSPAERDQFVQLLTRLLDHHARTS